MTEKTPQGYHYCYAKAVDECSDKGLIFDWRFIPAADDVFHKADLTQEQVEDVMHLHIFVIEHLFNPNNYGIGGKLLLILHFTGIPNALKPIVKVARGILNRVRAAYNLLFGKHE